MFRQEASGYDRNMHAMLFNIDKEESSALT